MIGRRLAFAGAAALASTPIVRAVAQAPLKVGWLSISPHPFIDAFRERLRELGYVEGQNLVIEYRYADGNAALLPSLVEELVKRGVNVLAVSGTGATDAALASAKGVPIVFVGSDPTVTGQIASLAWPGGAATGISTMSEDIGPKRIGLLREAVPSLARLALLSDDSPGAGRQTEQMTMATQKLGIEARAFSCADLDGFARVLADLAQDRWQGVIAVSSPFFAAHARTLAELTLKHRIPAGFDNPSFVRAGALMSYGADLGAAFRRQAELVIRLARGAKLADMPVEQATKFIFAFNQATAKVLGLSLSIPAMASVDELIE